VEAKKLSVGTAYATCDGAYVVPQDLEKRYAWKYDREKSKDVLVEFGKDGRVDPWSDCHITRDRGLKGRQPGIKCLRYKFDRDGKPIGKGVVTVVPPRDIKGTWDDYLLLYADTIRKKADDAEEYTRAHNIKEATEGRVKAKIKGATVWVSQRSAGSPSERHWEFQINLPRVPEKKLEAFLKELGV